MIFTFPQLNNQSNVATKQHLVPCTYMKKWKHNSSKKIHKIWLFDKTTTDNKYKSVEIGDIFYEEYFYDIKIGCNFMPDEALEDLFGCLLDYDIALNGKQLLTLRDYNDAYSHYEEWQIRDENGVFASDTDKKQLRDLLKSNRHTYIEKAWWYYENKWAEFIEDIEERIRMIKKGDKNYCLQSEDISNIMKYLTIYDMRNKDSNGFVDRIIKDMYGYLPKELLEYELEPIDRTHNFLNTVHKQYLHDSKIKGIYEYLKSDSGKYKIGLDSYCNNMSICFWCTTINCPFLTSEKPSMIIKNDDGYDEHILVATPTLLISLVMTNERKIFYVYDCSADDVRRYNSYIVKNSNRIISYSKQEDIKVLEGI